MTLKSYTLFDAFKRRSNPHKFLSTLGALSDAQIRKIARAIAVLEHTTYGNTEVSEVGAASFFEDLKDKDGIKYSAVIYDTDQGGTEFGPYIGYLVAYAIDRHSEEFDDLIDALRNATDNQTALAVSKKIQGHKGIVLYVTDIVRLRTEKAKTEYNAMLAEFVKRCQDENSIIVASLRETTSYKLVKRLEEQGVLEIFADVPDEEYFDGEIVHHVALKFLVDRPNAAYIIEPNANLLGAHLVGADLYNANLEGAHLEGANLYGANLDGANLQGADLLLANLNSANLEGANLQGANLRAAHLVLANLQGASLQGADLQGADLRKADLRNADLRGASYSSATKGLTEQQKAVMHFIE